MTAARKGDWVQIHQIILSPGERAPQVPDDTRAVPLELWVKGTALHDAEPDQQVTIETVTGRRLTGTLVSVAPGYTHDYGDFVPLLHQAGKQVRNVLFGGSDE